MAKSLSASTLISSTSLAAAATARATIDVRGVDGGVITWRITNGATAPTIQCVARILYSHNGTATPIAAAEGVAINDWKIIQETGGGILNAASFGGARGQYRFGPEAAFYEVEFTGNTGQAVTIEAYLTTYTY